MDPAAFEIEILIPGTASPGDLAALQRCEGKIVFLRALRRRVTLAEVDVASFHVNGVPPDTLSYLAAYRRRFPAVLARALPGRLLAFALDVGPLPRGAFIQNTGPFDLCNGDAVCLVPPLGGAESRLHLASLGVDLLFPLTVPLPQGRELLARVLARAVEALGGDGGAAANPRGADVMYYNGRQYQLAPDVQHRDGVEASVRTLLINMLFNINEGALVLLSLVPNLLVLGMQDGFANAILQLGSATREAGQLIRQAPPPPPQDGARRFVVVDALMAWLTSASRLGDVVGAKAVLRVCTFDGSAVIRPGERTPVVPCV
ncbi:capsid triplex subunit 2 [Beluga whale alphaherpesvirus 1]|uniref:Capsid triplex subunit 2 n=1 Tax=Beluga whale alphaherpesvirus 1 TaxID=1434720 RepID=A0A286MM63_9ALPH|nr:capsid triplex subunit 2 [Beluga whale alphaherpesvirus 1]ASW27089.1 capsid triplex subunit 2 [Beluga whale alphaherpesvirus 1]